MRAARLDHDHPRDPQSHARRRQSLAAIGRTCFAQTFGHLYPAADLAAFLEDAHGLERTAADLADPAMAAWLVERDGVAVGHALAGPCALPHPEVSPACGELKRLYILSQHQGGGTGSRLFAETLSWLERAGPRRIWIGVWSGNVGAQRLYRRLGFEKVGEYAFPVGSVRDHEFIMRRG